MLGFEIGRLGLQESLGRIEILKDISVFPLSEEGVVLHEDPSTHDVAREIRLLLQRVLDLDAKKFITKMRELYFHLFSVDHSHYRDLLMQAAHKEPKMTLGFCLDLLFSDDVLFIDDQKNLLDLFDVLQSLGHERVPAEALQRVRKLLSRPYFRRPSVHVRTIRFLAPVLESEDLAEIRVLYELDLIPRQELPWTEIQFFFALHQVPESLLEEPPVRPELHRQMIEPEDFESLRWAVGIEGSPLQIALRYLGCLVAAGPEATELFYRMTEHLPESSFQRKNFETDGQKNAFEQGLELLREDLLREIHRSDDWFKEIPEEELGAPGTTRPPSPWPFRLRLLPTLWTEFIMPTDFSDFSLAATSEVEMLEKTVEQALSLIEKRCFPSTDDLALGEELFESFLRSWRDLLKVVCPRLDVLP